MKPKLIVILGPTASGKSDLSIKLAKKFNGEIISADSRQVYRGMDIGTGKVTKKEQKLVPHHLLDVVSPKKTFSAGEFKDLANGQILKITAKNKIPFLVGGTPFYLYSVIDDLQFPEVSPNPKLRKQLAKKSPAELFNILQKLDKNRAANIDKNNAHRLIRAIEIIKATGKPVKSSPFLNKKQPYNTLILGTKKSPEELKKLIKTRLDKRLKQGMISEVKKLKKSGVNHNRLLQLGLEYKFIAEHLKGNLKLDDMKKQLNIAIYKFSKRQMTWFKSDPRIYWVTNQTQAEKLVKKFLQ